MQRNNGHFEGEWSADGKHWHGKGAVLFFLVHARTLSLFTHPLCSRTLLRLSVEEAKDQARAILVLVSDLKHVALVVAISAELDDKTLGGVLSHVCSNSGKAGSCAVVMVRHILATPFLSPSRPLLLAVRNCYVLLPCLMFLFCFTFGQLKSCLTAKTLRTPLMTLKPKPNPKKVTLHPFLSSPLLSFPPSSLLLAA